MFVVCVVQCVRLFGCIVCCWFVVRVLCVSSVGVCCLLIVCMRVIGLCVGLFDCLLVFLCLCVLCAGVRVLCLFALFVCV